MHGNHHHHHHHHHQRTDLGGIFTIGPFVPCTPLQNPKYASDVNMPSQTKWRNVGWKRSTFFIQRLQTFFIFVTFFTFFNVFYFFFLERFLHLCSKQFPAASDCVCICCCWCWHRSVITQANTAQSSLLHRQNEQVTPFRHPFTSVARRNDDA